VAGDYYEVLGVARTATGDELQSAYRKLARRYHPDVNSDPKAVDRFKSINEAYHVLADPETRARYDRFGPDFRQIPDDVAAGARGSGSAYRPRGSARAAGTRRAGGGSSAGINIEDLFGGGVSGFEDLLVRGVPVARCRVRIRRPNSR
jgi:curved DNA-binding protein